MTAADLREWLDQLDDDAEVVIGADGASLEVLGGRDYIVLGCAEDWEEITA